jgi:integrase
MTDAQTDPKLPTKIIPTGRVLTAEEFNRLSDVPPEREWFRNIRNPSTRRDYENAIRDFMQFTGVARPEEFRTVTRARVIAWRDDLARREPPLGGATVRHRLAALSSLFEYLCDKNAVSHNPVKGVKRPRAENGEGKTPALGDHQARELLVAPGKDTAAGEETIKEKRDRAILSTLLFHALRREELCKLKVKEAGAPRRSPYQGRRQGRENPVSAAAPGHQRVDPRLPRSAAGRTERACAGAPLLVRQARSPTERWSRARAPGRMRSRGRRRHIAGRRVLRTSRPREASSRRAGR